jgi:hypothetical protein
MQNHTPQHSERGLIATIDHDKADTNSAVSSLALLLHPFRFAPFGDFCSANFFMEIYLWRIVIGAHSVTLSLKISFSKPYFAKTGFPSIRNMGRVLIMQGKYHVHGLDSIFRVRPDYGYQLIREWILPLHSSHHTNIIESSKQTMQNTCASIQLISSSELLMLNSATSPRSFKRSIIKCYQISTSRNLPFCEAATSK